MKADCNATFTPPKAAIDAFARCIYPAILEYFDSEQGQREFAEWKQKQERSSNKDENSL